MYYLWSWKECQLAQSLSLSGLYNPLPPAQAHSLSSDKSFSASLSSFSSPPLQSSVLFFLSRSLHKIPDGMVPEVLFRFRTFLALDQDSPFSHLSTVISESAFVQPRGQIVTDSRRQRHPCTCYCWFSCQLINALLQENGCYPSVRWSSFIVFSWMSVWAEADLDNMVLQTSNWGLNI